MTFMPLMTPIGVTPPATWESASDSSPATPPPSNSNAPCWHSRDHRPRFDRPGAVQSITIRLADALPAALPIKWRYELAHLPAGERELELRSRIEDHLDGGYGTCLLRRQEIGRLVEDAFFLFDSSRYHLLAWCVMPNHAHVVVETQPDWEPGELAHTWKSHTGNEANKLLQRRGPFWQFEHYDRAVLDGAHFESVVRDVEDNPVKAGLVPSAGDWTFGSARFSRRMAPSEFLFDLPAEPEQAGLLTGA